MGYLMGARTFLHTLLSLDPHLEGLYIRLPLAMTFFASLALFLFTIAIHSVVNYFSNRPLVFPRSTHPT
jgi:hypothetical protein